MLLFIHINCTRRLWYHSIFCSRFVHCCLPVVSLSCSSQKLNEYWVKCCFPKHLHPFMLYLPCGNVTPSAVELRESPNTCKYLLMWPYYFYQHIHKLQFSNDCKRVLDFLKLFVCFKSSSFVCVLCFLYVLVLLIWCTLPLISRNGLCS